MSIHIKISLSLYRVLLKAENLLIITEADSKFHNKQLCVCSAYLETLSEQTQDVQDAEADLGGGVAFKQGLMVDFCF